MTVAIVCIAIEVVLIIAFAPLPIRVKAHFSLSRKSCQADISVVGAKVVRLRAQATENSIKLLVNGKEKQPKDNNIAMQNVIRTVNIIKVEGIRIVPSVIALIGIDEAKNSAMLCALLCGIQGITAYPCINGERFDADISLKTKLNVFQALRLMVSASA